MLYDLHFKNNYRDQVFIGVNSGTTTFTFNIAGMDTNPSFSYYFSV
jgi:vancomycin resistance protein YoaR